MSEVTLEPGILEQLEDADPLAPDETAPYGYTIDRKTGERRAKKLPGRPAKTDDGPVPVLGESPDLETLKKEKVKRDEDRAPGKPVKSRGRRGQVKTEPELPPYRQGVIAKGMNKLYAKMGRIIRAMDYDIGQAVIASTRKESEDDVTVGEAWDELARTNPRIRRFLLKLITGGAWTQLFMAHAPIFLAVIMKDSIRKHIPMHGLLESVLGDDESTGAPSEFADVFGNMTPEDGQQMMDMAMNLANNMGIDLGAMMNGGRTGNPVRPVTGEVVEE